ncbi:hypothetical protein Trydic_g5667 [Trypoxylus dichotomus]
MNLKGVYESAVETCCLLGDVYDDDAQSEPTCGYWFQCFKSDDFGINGKERDGVPKEFQNEEPEELLDVGPCQTLEELSTALDVDRSTIGKHLHALKVI